MKPNRTSSNSGRHNYQRYSWWAQESNQFWNTPMYSQASKDYFNNWLADWAKRERSLVNLSENIKAV